MDYLIKTKTANKNLSSKKKDSRMLKKDAPLRPIFSGSRRQVKLAKVRKSEKLLHNDVAGEIENSPREGKKGRPFSIRAAQQ